MDLEALFRIIPYHFQSWNNSNVIQWLQYIYLQHYSSTFKQQKIIGLDLIYLTNVYLKQKLEIKSRIHRVKILNWINFLIAQSSNIRSFLEGIESQEEMERQSMDKVITTQPSWNQHPETASQEQNHSNSINFLTQPNSLRINRHENIQIYPKFGEQVRVYSCNGGINLSIGKGANNSIVIPEQTIQLHHCSIYHKNNDHYLKPSIQTLESDREIRKNRHLNNSGVWIKIDSKMQIEQGIGYCIEMGFTQFKIKVNYLKNMIMEVQSSYTSIPKSFFKFDPSNITEIRIGRSTKYDISFQYDTTMSSFHGIFSFFDEDWHYQDIATTNGSWRKCEVETLITDKMSFRIGRTIHIFQCRLIKEKDSTKESVSSRGICRKCKKVAKNCYFTPCKHVVCCLKCGQQSNWCPKCSTGIKSVEKIFRT